MGSPSETNEMMNENISNIEALANIDPSVAHENDKQTDAGFLNNKNKNHPKEHKIILTSQKVILNEQVKESYSVADAKYKEDCHCVASDYAEVLMNDLHKRLFKNSHKINFRLFQYVIVQTESGIDSGTIIACGNDATEKLHCCYKNEEPDNVIVRAANAEDLEKINKNKLDQESIINRTKALVNQHNLEMKVTDADWQYDRQKLTVFFTAPQRIDFRELVKDLARTFKTRIELRQISTREEARRIGGMGPCGLNLCCSSFVNEFCHVTLDHARHQHLSNNVAKLSGYCGRLKCCLLYEHDIYIEVYDKFPMLNSRIQTDDGLAILNKIDVFKEIGVLYYPDSGLYRHLACDDLKMLVETGRVTAPPEEELKAKERELYDNEELKILEAEF